MKLKVGHYLIVIVLLFLNSMGCKSEEEVQALPNVVLIVADDMGWGDLSIHGNSNVHTPALDALARTGTSYSNFFVSAVCSPTRAELLTGRHALSVGVTGTGAGRERINLGVRLLPEVLAKAGYTNALFGKWHNGTQGPYHPLSRGFDTFYGFTSGHWGSYFDYLIEDGDQIAPFEGYLPDVLTSKTIEHLAQQEGHPSFTMLAFPTPHSPMQVPDQWYSPVAGRNLDSLGNGQGVERKEFTTAALAMVENLDWNVGRIVNALDSLGLRQNTLLVFMSDNGPNSWRWNGDLKGKKGSVDEGGVKSPLILNGPGLMPQGVENRSLVSVRDLLPTLLSLIGVDVQLADIDGTSALTPSDSTLIAIERQSLRWNPRAPTVLSEASNAIVNQWRDQISIRTDGYRLDAEGRLYDMRVDAAQERNITAEFPALADSLSLIAEGFRQKVLHPNLIPDERPFAVGGGKISSTLLPARDAKALGRLKRSSKWPNDSYFYEWEDENALLEWPVEAFESGIFDVQLYYALTEENSGCGVSLSSTFEATEKVVLPAHNPNAIGATNDRVLRDESYVQRWATHTLGQLELKKGADTLRLKQYPVAGRSGAEVWGIMLSRSK